MGYTRSQPSAPSRLISGWGRRLMSVALKSEPEDGPVPVPVPLKKIEPLELSVVMPCLNEATTLESCIRNAQRVLQEANLGGEVVGADNGSTDGEPDIAERLGARR